MAPAVECRIGEQLACRRASIAAHSSPKKRSCVSRPALFYPASQRGRYGGVGHVGGEAHVRVVEGACRDRLDPLAFVDRLGQAPPRESRRCRSSGRGSAAVAASASATRTRCADRRRSRRGRKGPTRPLRRPSLDGRHEAETDDAGLEVDAGSVTGARQAKRSQTYTAGCPSTRPLPSSSGTPSAGPTATTVFGVERGQRGARDGAVDRPRDRDLARGREPEVERAQHPAEGPRRPAQHRLDEPEHRHGLALELVVPPDPCRAGAGRARASSCPRGSGCRRGPSSARRAPRRPRAPGRTRRAPRPRTARPRAARAVAPPQPAQLAGRDVELEQAVRRVCVVVEEALAAHPALAPRTREPAVVPRERAEQELPRARQPQPVGPLEPPARLGQRRQGEAVPRGEHLVVEAGLRPLRTHWSSRARRSGSSSPRMIERPSSNGSSSSPGTPSSSVHVNVSPSTPLVSASWADARPPSG